MNNRIQIQMTPNAFPTRIEVYYKGELNRVGGAQAGVSSAYVKLPGPIEDCEIKIMPCTQQGTPVGQSYTYVHPSDAPKGKPSDAPEYKSEYEDELEDTHEDEDEDEDEDEYMGS